MPAPASISPASGRLWARVSKRFGSAFSLGAEIEVPAGFTVLFGRSGAGKSTLLDCIAGLQLPDVGHIELRGDEGEVWFDSENKINMPVGQRRAGYTFQSIALFPHMNVRQNVEYGLAALPKEERRVRSGELLWRFGMERHQRATPSQLSGGERQRVLLARALAPQPRALLLDEPLSALDVPTKSAILDDLRRWQELHPIPVLYVSHNRSEVLRIGERLLVMEAGQIVASGPPSEALAAAPENEDY